MRGSLSEQEIRAHVRGDETEHISSWTLAEIERHTESYSRAAVLKVRSSLPSFVILLRAGVVVEVGWKGLVRVKA